MRRILALAPHPDDIEIGCGGALSALSAAGDEVHLFVATDGSRGGEAAVRRAEQEAAAAIMGVHALHWGGFTDTRLSAASAELIEHIGALVKRIMPDMVFVNHHVDTHQDHRALASAAHSATRYVPNVLAYETPTSDAFDPTVFCDISAFMQHKLDALCAHASQVQRTNIQGLSIIDIATSTAHYRGMNGRLNSAEAFMPRRMQLACASPLMQE